MASRLGDHAVRLNYHRLLGCSETMLRDYYHSNLNFAWSCLSKSEGRVYLQFASVPVATVAYESKINNADGKLEEWQQMTFMCMSFYL